MIFRPKITNTNTNPNTITNINTEILNTNIRSMIFPFKTTNQTQILDLWFSLLNHKHKLTLRRTEPRKKKWRSRWSKAVRPWARKMRGAEGCATVRSATRRTNGVERVESCRLVTVWRQCKIDDRLPVLDYLWACGRVRQWMRKLR